jgi:hypothetical protein
MKITAYAVAALLLASSGPVLFTSQARGQVSHGEEIVKNGTMRATMKQDGSYELDFMTTGWHLDGKLSGRVSDLSVTVGKDKIGQYHQVSASFKNGTRTAGIRVYDTLPLALFRDEWKTAGENATPFPTFRRLPQGLLRLSFQEKNFGFYEFGQLGPDGPWSLFDKENHVMILSPADHFLVSSMEELPDGTADSRIVSSIGSIPAGFVHSTLVAAGTGMNQVFAAWGDGLKALGGKQMPANDADVTLSKLGYWTDNKTTYYYKFDSALGYTGTLLAVRDEFKKLGIPFGYMQLDSWFYPKGPKNRWDTLGNTPEFGENEYRADKELFPDGMDAFQQKLGLPMVTHARWVSPQSPYHSQFEMSGNVIIDPRFWEQTADYLHKSDVVTYEQDWLDKNAHADVNLTDPLLFLGEMSKAMAADGMSIQYCMPLPSDYMASTLYPNVQTIRTSGDGFERRKWDEFLYDSRMATALGVWPWTDAFFSKDLGNLVISTLSAGPVGVGDAIGQFNVKNLMAVVRQDGTIIKPDTSLLPIDDVYKSDALGEHSPMVATATTSFGDLNVRYVFAYPRQSSDSSVSVALKSLGFSSPVFAYNWVTHKGQLIPVNGVVDLHFADGWAYQILSPVSRDGLALLGDTDKIAPAGRQRISEMKNDGALSATIRFVAGEQALTISGYAAHQPKIRAMSGDVTDVTYDDNSHLFTSQVTAGKSQEAKIRITAR